MPQPNLLWLMCDQLRAHALGANGDLNLNGHTPHIDRLAREGVNFTLACSQYPICTPFRGGLVTGRHAHINGVRVHGDMLKTDRQTIAHAFRNAGYRTSWVGKWHLASTQGVLGWKAGADYWVHPYLRGGFEDWYGFDCSNHFYKTRYSHGDQIFPPIDLEGYQTDGLTDLSLNYLANTAAKLKQPWFHCLSVEAPHPGVDENEVFRNPAPAEYEARFKAQDIQLRGNVPASIAEQAQKMNAGYYAQIANLDHNIGRILKWLDDSGQAENTLVVFFADHGEMGGSHGMWDKGCIYDESIRIPMIMRLPGQIPAAARVDHPFSGLDIFPTCAGLCGVPIPPDVQGIDHAAATLGAAGPAPNEVLIQWLGKALYGFADFEYRAIRERRYTYGVSTAPEMSGLFDNEADPLQRINLFGKPEHKSLQARLHGTLRRAIIRSAETPPAFIDEIGKTLA